MSGHQGYKTESPMDAAQNDSILLSLTKQYLMRLRMSAESMKAHNTIKEPTNGHGSPRSEVE